MAAAAQKAFRMQRTRLQSLGLACLLAAIATSTAAAPPISTTTPKLGGLLPPIALPPAQPVKPPGNTFLPPIGNSKPKPPITIGGLTTGVVMRDGDVLSIEFTPRGLARVCQTPQLKFHLATTGSSLRTWDISPTSQTDNAQFFCQTVIMPGMNTFIIKAAFKFGRGVPDGAGSVRIDYDGQAYELPVRFIAARENQTFNLNSTVAPNVNLKGPTLPMSLGYYVPLLDRAWLPPGAAPIRSADGENIDCPAPGGRDVYRLMKPLKNGFVVVGAGVLPVSRMDIGGGDGSGNAGSRVMLGRWAALVQQNGDIWIDWGVWRAHTSPISANAGPTAVTIRRAHDSCQSNYLASITVSGPAGLSPW